MKYVDVDVADVQGLVRSSYKHLKEACYFVLQIKNAAAARTWLAGQKFASVADWPSPDTVLQVAFTFTGLRVLGVSDTIQDAFPHDFRSGMVGDEARSRRLGDVGPNHPTYWRWGGPRKPEPHLLIMLFAKCLPDGPGLQMLKSTIQDQLWKQAFAELKCLSTSDMGGEEPFGFADGISQPELVWKRKRKVRERNTRKYTNESALGEFLLGYPNEYARYTDRPLVSRKDDPHDILLPAEDLPDKKDFCRNGTYLVLRDLEQDVAAFWKYADKETDNPDQRRDLAEAIVGRKKCGKPLVERDPRRIGGVRDKDTDKNHFTFRKDPDGTACPLGAHIRRANPRTADLPEGTKWGPSVLWRMLGFGGRGSRYDLLESARFHRLLRRGREYGPCVTIDEALQETVPPKGGRGLRFICLNANILRQFEFVQNSWISNPKFDGLDESDPLLGNREPLFNKTPTNTFTRPQKSGVNRRYGNLPQFVTVRGGAYFFMPSLRALRYICGR
jgi:Dyp-type peroxidase family